MHVRTEKTDPPVTKLLDAPERLGVLHATVPDMAIPDRDFDGIVEIAAGLFDAQIALVTLIDREWQWFKAAVGTDETRAPSEDAFCPHVTAAADSSLVVLDASTDPRFARHRQVKGPPFLRFYAGAPLRSADGHVLGALCILDAEARTLDQHERALLEKLAADTVETISRSDADGNLPRQKQAKVEATATVGQPVPE